MGANISPNVEGTRSMAELLNSLLDQLREGAQDNQALMSMLDDGELSAEEARSELCSYLADLCLQLEERN